jgi:hypothetical protein
MAAADIVAISSEIRFNVLVSVISLAASLACCGTTYSSPSLPMFAFVLDAGNVALSLLWAAAERGGRVCVAGRGGAGRESECVAERGGAERRWAERLGLVKCVDCSAHPGAHRSHRSTFHRYKKSTLHLFFLYRKILEVLGPLLLLVSVCQSVRSESCFTSFLFTLKAFSEVVGVLFSIFDFTSFLFFTSFCWSFQMDRHSSFRTHVWHLTHRRRRRLWTASIVSQLHASRITAGTF